jgi:hypothetical protein
VEWQQVVTLVIKSCFYRSLEGKNELVFTETEKVFDPEEVYEGQENPTIL